MRWALVGRDDAIERCFEGLAEGATGIEIVGEAGVGKTRLLEEIAMRLAGGDARVIELKAGRGTRDIPLGALSHLAQPRARLGEPQEEAIWRAGRALVGPSGPPPLILLDDVHLLDDVSAAVLEHLVRGREARLALTRREEEQLSPAVRAMITDAALVRVQLGPLARPGIEALAAEMLSVKLDAASARELWRKTGGNPLFLRELLALARDRDAIRGTGDRARLDLDFRPEGRLLDVIKDRISQLDAGEGRLLKLLSLAGPIGRGLVAEVSEPDALAGLEARGLVEWRTDGARASLHPGHTLFTEASRELTRRSEQMELLGGLAHAATRIGRRRSGDGLLHATWAMDAGIDLDATTLVEAAEEAFGRLGPEASITFARAAVDRGGGDRASLALGEALTGASRAGEAAAILRDLIGPTHTEPVRARAARALAWGRFQAGDVGEAFALLEQTREALKDPALQDELAVQRAELGIPAGNYTPWREIVDSVLRKPAQEVDPRTLLTAHAVTSAREGFCGLPAAGRGRADMVLSLLEDNPEVTPLMRFRVSVVRDYCTLSLGDAWSLYEDMRERTPPASSSARIPHEAFIGYVASHAGRPRTALSHLDPALEGLRGADPLGQLGYGLANAAECAACIGERRRAWELLDELDALAPTRLINFSPETARGRAAALSHLGEPERAREAGERAADEIAPAGLLTLEAPLAHQRALLGQSRAVERLAEISGAGEAGWFVDAAHAHARALHENDPGALLAAGEQLALFGRAILAAEATLQAAHALLAAGAPARALAAELRSEVLARPAEGAGTRVLEHRPAILTPSERTVAERTAHGASARTIAADLHKSRRTIENQLSSVYRKLEIGGRDALTELFADYSSGRVA